MPAPARSRARGFVELPRRGMRRQQADDYTRRLTADARPAVTLWLIRIHRSRIARALAMFCAGFHQGELHRSAVMARACELSGRSLTTKAERRFPAS